MLAICLQHLWLPLSRNCDIIKVLFIIISGLFMIFISVELFSFIHLWFLQDVLNLCTASGDSSLGSTLFRGHTGAIAAFIVIIPNKYQERVNQLVISIYSLSDFMHYRYNFRSLTRALTRETLHVS